MVADVIIRPSERRDSPVLQDIELAAGARFRTVGMADIADADPFTLDELAAYVAGGRSWVAVDGADRAVGYVVVDEVDGQAHVEQVSVVPERQGEGIGAALLDHVAAWAASGGRSALTLTTFTDVPWNRPLYEHLGFRVLADDELGPELRAVRTHEATLGLDPAIRVCMRRDVR
jgi:GNAT superfamily N-acetyltransferase